MYAIINANIVLQDQVLSQGPILVDGDKILNVGVNLPLPVNIQSDTAASNFSRRNRLIAKNSSASKVLTLDALLFYFTNHSASNSISSSTTQAESFEIGFS